MILSPYTLLFLCVVHSPHSFAHYTLHKRMEVIEGVQATTRVAKTASEAGRSSVPTAVNTAVALSKSQTGADALKDADLFLPKELHTGGELHPHSSSEHPVHLDTHNPTFHPPELDPSLHPPPPIEPPKLTAILRLKHKFASGWNNISLSFRRFTNVFSRSSAPRTFSYAPKLAADFRGIPQDSEQIKTLVSDLLEQLVNKKSAKSYQSYVRANPLLTKIEEITQETTDYLSQIQKFIAHDMPKYEEEISRSSEQIALKLAPALKDSANPSTASLGNLALQLARFNSHELLEARIGIRLYGGRRVESLANLHGFLGPRNVFSSQMASILRDESIVGKLPEGFDSGRFVKELEEVQTHLIELARYQSAARQAAKARQPLPPFPHDQVTELEKFQENQAKLFNGDRQGFQTLISKIEKSEPYKAFQSDLNFPRDIGGYELQFVQPLGSAENLNPGTMTVTDAQRLNIRLHRPVNSVFALSGQSRELALDNTVKRMAMAAEARELSQKMSSLYTDKGLDLIAQTIRTLPS